MRARLAAAVGVAAGWVAVFALVRAWEPGGLWTVVVLPPLAAALVPVSWLTRRGDWGSPEVRAALWHWRPSADVVPVLLLGLLLVASEPAVPPAVVLLACLVTGWSEELTSRGVVQGLLEPLAPLPRVLLSAALLPAGYAVALPLLGADRALTVYLVGMVLCFGIAHAALRLRGTPVLVLGALNALVVWPQFSHDAFEPLTLVAALVAAGYGLFLATEPGGVTGAASGASARTPPDGRSPA